MARFVLSLMRPAVAALAALALVVSVQRTLLANDRPMVLPTDPSPLVVQTDSGRRSFTIEVARTADERKRGLMYRTSMPDDHGMLFVFDRTQQLEFWMKNTPMPLDLIFIGPDGKVKAVRRGKPFSTDIISPDAPCRFVLEVKAGIAQKTGIADGDPVRHPIIDAVDGAG